MGKASRKNKNMPENRCVWPDGRDILGIKRALHHVDAGPLHTINESEKSVLFHEIHILFKNRFRFADSPDQTIMHPHYGIAELFESLQAV